MTNRQIYIQTVLNIYLQMPDTPHRVCPNDDVLAGKWFARKIPVSIVETALLLGSARRLYRRSGALKLAPVRSIAYFAPVVEELVVQPPPPTFIQYLRFKLGFATRMNVSGKRSASTTQRENFIRWVHGKSDLQINRGPGKGAAGDGRALRA